MRRSLSIFATLALAATPAWSLRAFDASTFAKKPDDWKPRVYQTKRDDASDAYNSSVPRWEWWPDNVALPGNPAGAYLNQSNGVDVWYAEIGDKGDYVNGKYVPRTPVVFLHGGTSESEDFSYQVADLEKDHYIIVTDTRGQGRSPFVPNVTAMHYDDFTLDVIAILDHLNVSKAAFVGWSDGAITALDIAMNYTERVDRVFAHAANAQYNLSIPVVVPPLVRRDDDDDSDVDPWYLKLSPTPDQYDNMVNAVVEMWLTEPAWGAEAFAKINAPIWIVDGDHDESITRNQPDAMAAWTPFAGELILPQVGHDASNEDPTFFNFAVRYFLSMKFDGDLPYYGDALKN